MPGMQRTLFCVSALVLASSLSLPSAEVAAEPPLSRARLVSSVTGFVPGVPFDVGVLFDIRDGWHGYGDPPGDSGMAPQISLSLPPGWQAGAVRFPPSLTHTDEAGTTNVYYRQVLLRLTLQPPADLQPGTRVSLRGHAMWLICKEACVPQQADLHLDLEVRHRTVLANPTWQDWLRSGTGTKHPKPEHHDTKAKGTAR